MTEFAFTMKFTSKPKSVPSDYINGPIKIWQQKGVKFEMYRFESDSKGICHVHGIIILTKNFYRKCLRQKGLHFKIDEIYDRKGWMSYVLKNQKLKVNLIREVSQTQEGSFGSVPNIFIFNIQ